MMARWEGGLIRSAVYTAVGDTRGRPLAVLEGEVRVTPSMSVCRDVAIRGRAVLNRHGGVSAEAWTEATWLGRRGRVDSYLTTMHEALFEDDISGGTRD